MDNNQNPQNPSRPTPPPVPSRPAPTPPTPPSIPQRPVSPELPSLPPRPSFTPPKPPTISIRPPAPPTAPVASKPAPTEPTTFLPPKPFTPPPTSTIAPKPITPPPVKPPEISLRTLKSDLESKSLFQKEPLKPTAPSPGLTKIEAKPSKIKPALIIGGVVIFGIVLALVGYFVIFPYFFPTETPTPTALPTPSASQLPTTPVDISPTVPTSAFLTHQSLLKTAADIQASVNISSLNFASIKQSLTNEASNRPAGTNVLKEILLSGTAGQLNFSDVFPLLIPEFSKFELTNIFEEDFTTLLYYDANGAWPAWIAKVKSGGSVNDAKTLISRLETSTGLVNLYLTNPGTPSAGFKTGQVSAIQTRYLIYSQKDASLNYAWVGDKLVISTSFNGLKNILPKL